MSRLPETEQSLLRHLRAEKRQRLRDEGASPYSRSGMSLIAEGIASVDGQIQSHDFDGTDRTHLGTTGWLLGWADGQPSMLVLNGIDVYADLAAKTASLASQAATLATTVSDLAAAQATLTSQQASLTSQLASINTLIGQQVTGDVGNAAQSSISLTTTATAYAGFTLAVPSGYTIARVHAVTQSFIAGTIPVSISTRIGGSAGSVMTIAPSSGFANGGSTYARTITGLSGGTIAVESVAYQGAGSTVTAYITTSAVVTFLR